jgi:small-conductance mechanosensitive channel
MLHYVILLVGFFAAVAALGLDMTKVTILAGAFSVGVGLGLQSISNNFVSGLILLFERPVNVGDVVQIDDVLGVVERIGIRASIIRTTSGSEVIVPNGKLISERLTNWTLSNRQHGVEIPVAVAQGTDPSRVITLLERIAAAHPLVTKDPPPQALVVKLGPDSLGFELRAWTDRTEQWMQIRSDLAIAISAALAAEKIALR